ncbi:hypothetical protein AAAU36_06465 [Phascolarctobacterium faecium]
MLILTPILSLLDLESELDVFVFFAEVILTSPFAARLTSSPLTSLPLMLISFSVAVMLTLPSALTVLPCATVVMLLD